MDDVLVKRRSIRHFEKKAVPDDLLWKVFELCRFAPTASNTESYRFVVVRDREKLEFFAALRGQSSAPIARAPMAVAVVSDPSKSRRYVQDGCIAAYHFLLAAARLDLGTCWIAAMDRDDVKEALGIDKEHYVATITPLGYPAGIPEAPPRRGAKDMVRFLE